jgi:hypothetical protein
MDANTDTLESKVHIQDIMNHYIISYLQDSYDQDAQDRIFLDKINNGTDLMFMKVTRVGLSRRPILLLCAHQCPNVS